MTEPTRAPEESQGDIDALLSEDRVFPPSAAFREQANVARRLGLRAGGTRPRGVLGVVRRGTRVVAALGHGARVEPAAREVVRRRHAQRQRQLPRPPRPTTARRNKAALIWEGEPGDSRDADLLAAAPRGEPLRQRPEGARRPPRRPRGHLHADGARAAGRDARVRPDRRRAQRRLRRLQRRVAARPDQRRAGQGARHGRRRLPARGASCPSRRWPTRR